MAFPILVFVEQRDGAIKKSSLEAVSEARRLSDQVAAVLVGPSVRSLADAPGRCGAATVYVAEDSRLASPWAEGAAAAVAAAARASGARAIFFAASAMGKDLAPTVAAMLDVGLATDCTALRLDGDTLVARRPVYAGKAAIEVGFARSPAVVSLRPNVFKPDASAGGAPKIEALTVDFPAPLSVVRQIVPTAQGKVELTEAAIIVSGGRGFKGPEHFHLRDELAAALGAAVGASRAVVDAGWRPHAEQVGQTGKTVSPTLYVACGISGAIQHLAGMSSSKVIVAINKDRDAPIFKVATYGLVGDLFEVLPELTRQARALLTA
jgi:electron transfer flavoprotein alpha subunit